MLDIDEMNTKEIHDLLQKVGIGHLGCALDGHPYVLPMHYYFDDPDIYIFTTVGMKTQYMDANPEVCLQVEDVHDLKHWRSVTVTGRAEHLTEPEDVDRVMQLVKRQNPTLSPAINRTWIDVWGREEIMALYCIHPREMCGRMTDGASHPLAASRDSLMDYIVETPKSFNQASTDLESAVVRHGFGVLHIHDLGRTLRSKSIAFDEECKIFEVCNPEQAAKVLAADMRLNMALPCRISVFTEKGTTKIGLIKPGQMLAALAQDAALAQVAQEVEETTMQMVDEAK